MLEEVDASSDGDRAVDGAAADAPARRRQARALALIVQARRMIAKARGSDGADIELDLGDVSDDISRLLDNCEELDLSQSFRVVLLPLDEALTPTWQAADGVSTRDKRVPPS